MEPGAAFEDDLLDPMITAIESAGHLRIERRAFGLSTKVRPDPFPKSLLTLLDISQRANLRDRFLAVVEQLHGLRVEITCKHAVHVPEGRWIGEEIPLAAALSERRNGGEQAEKLGPG